MLRASAQSKTHVPVSLTNSECTEYDQHQGLEYINCNLIDVQKWHKQLIATFENFQYN